MTKKYFPQKVLPGRYESGSLVTETFKVKAIFSGGRGMLRVFYCNEETRKAIQFHLESQSFKLSIIYIAIRESHLR